MTSQPWRNAIDIHCKDLGSSSKGTLLAATNLVQGKYDYNDYLAFQGT
jgi:hypothetical protein